MNQMITQMVDILFQDVVENEETRALHDEVMNNCQEHYQDLIDSGMQEDEAVSAVMESLSGMQEVVDQYPKKEAVPGEAEPAESEPEAPAAGKEWSGACAVFPAAGVRKINVVAGAFDVEVTGIDDSQISVFCDQADRLSMDLNQDEGILTVQVIRMAEQIAEDIKKASEEEADAPEAGSAGRSVMDMTLNELLKKAKSLAATVFKNISVQVNDQFFQAGEVIHISVPESLLPVLEINTGSGDVRVEKTHSPEYTLRSASGDISLDCSVKEAIDRVFASTASGDIRVSSAWAKEAEISAISGDVDLDGDFGDLTCKSVSGNVDFEGTAVSLKSKSVSGDVQLTMVQAAAGSISADATSGDIRISLPEDCAAAHVESSSTVGEIWTDIEDAGDSAPLQIKVRTISGDVQVRKG